MAVQLLIPLGNQTEERANLRRLPGENATATALAG
jgi:hypothetical protein